MSHVDTLTQHPRGTEIDRLDDDFFIPGPGPDTMAAEVALKETAGVFGASLHYSFQYHIVYHAISKIPVSNLGYISTVGCEESTTAGDS